MLIKIIKGNYGYHNGVSITVKTPADPPFNVSEEEALRLYKLGIAMIFENEGKNGSFVKTPDGVPDVTNIPHADVHKIFGNKGESEDIPADDSTDSEDEADTDAEDLGDDEESGETDDTPKYSQENTNAELQAIADEWGIELPNRANKAQILEILDSHFGNAPKLSAREPE